MLADPHIQCSLEGFEPWLFRLDSDRYLTRAVSRLLVAMEPDAVVVVGDMFAEGYKASQQDWTDYLQVGVWGVGVWGVGGGGGGGVGVFSYSSPSVAVSTRCTGCS